jgi:acyl-CoA thioesterase FadM
VPVSVKKQFVVGWGDCAPSGAVYYPNYFRWFDQSMWALFAENGLPIPELEKKFHIVGVPLKNLACDFLAPCRLHDPVQLESRFVTIGEKDFEIEHILTRNETPLVRGHDFRFWGVRSPETGKLQRQTIPPEVMAKLT